MQCPVCDEKMKEVERQGVAIDICPGCKGVWLDRGELDKLIEMSRNEEGAVAQAPIAPRREEPVLSASEREYRAPSGDRHGHDDDHDHRRERDSHDNRGQSHGSSSGNRRKGSWLADIIGAVGGGED